MLRWSNVQQIKGQFRLNRLIQMSKYGHKCNVCSPNNTVQKCSYVVEGDSFKCAYMIQTYGRTEALGCSCWRRARCFCPGPTLSSPSGPWWSSGRPWASTPRACGNTDEEEGEEKEEEEEEKVKTPLMSPTLWICESRINLLELAWLA